MHDGWQLFSPTLLMDVKENLLKRLFALYALVSMRRRGESEKHTHTIASPHGDGAMGAGNSFAVYFLLRVRA
jgi:hypothetical protein